MKYLVLVLILTSFHYLESQNVLCENDVLDISTIGKEQAEYLSKCIDGYNVIGLGEATHGTKEFIDIRTEIIKSLVENDGFRTLVIESHYVAVQDLDNYIQGGDGDGYNAVLSTLRGVYYKYEFYELVEWLRDYNLQAPEEDRFHVYGYEIYYQTGNAKRALQLIRKYGNSDNNLEEELDWFINLKSQRKYDKETLKRFNSLQEKLDEQYSSIKETAEVSNQFDLHCFTILNQWFDYISTKGGYKRSSKRDKYMAENCDFIYKLSGHKKMIVWSHNAHVSKKTDQGKIPPMGKYLDQNPLFNYYVIGTAFNSGGFRAGLKNARQSSDCYVGETLEGCSDLEFAKNNCSTFFIDFASVEPSNDYYDLIHKRTLSRHVGGSFYPEDKWRNYRRHILSNSYDGLIFVSESSPATPFERSLVEEYFRNLR